MTNEISQYVWDGDQLWWKGQGYDHPTNPHRYTGIDANGHLYKSESLAALKIVIADLLNSNAKAEKIQPIQFFERDFQTEPQFPITFDLPESTFSQLLAYCQKEGKPVGEVAPAAIAHYLRQMEIQETQMAKALAD
jgi:hypothetical protein